ncbi:hypothetical protein TNCV_5053181 [Trichonephila clavipes]|nr:hypothetical protein TNCV_5053181 [Trichonephila clavipes]
MKKNKHYLLRVTGREKKNLISASSNEILQETTFLTQELQASTTVLVKYCLLAIFGIVTEISQIGLNIWTSSTEVRQRAVFCIPTSASQAVPLLTYITIIQHFPAKITGTPKIQFQILITSPEIPPRLTSGSPVRASSATRVNENPHAGLELEAISPNSSDIRQSYRCF